MFGWHELQNYHPLIALFGGIAAFYCFAGTGALGLRLLRVSNAGTLRRAFDFIFGVLAISLTVQLLAMAGYVGMRAAQILAALMLFPGIVAFVEDIRELRKLNVDAPAGWVTFTWWVPFGIVVTALLATAMAPESRADEAAYHALIPARILEDGALRVYELPWEATVWPQLVWHHALVPIFATAGSPAARVMACCVAILLALTAATIVYSRLGSGKFAALAAVAVLAGAYPTTLLVTLGPHAFGCLATFVACWSVVSLRMGDQIPTSSALRIGIACAAMIAGKVTMLPLALLLMALATHALTSQTKTTVAERVKILAALAMPTVLALGPILIWGWMAARSPLGIMSAGIFDSPEFGAESLRIYEGTRALFTDMFNWRFELSYWNLLIVIGLVAAVFLNPGQERLRFALLLACQVAVIILLLPKEIRHLGGLQYVLFVGGFCALVSNLRLRTVGDASIAAGGLVAIAPWAALGLYISSINIPLMAGRQSPIEFLQRYSGLFEDYQRLDRILPADATIVLGHSAASPTQFAWFARPPIFYAPRRVAANDRAPDREVPQYLLYIGQGEPDPMRENQLIDFDPVVPPDHTIGKTVYSNPSALFYPSRTPVSSRGRRVRIDVYELTPHVK